MLNRCLIRVALVILFFGFNFPATASVASCSVREHVYDRYLSRFKFLKDCVIDAAEKYNVPEWALLVVLKQENGPINGYLTNNDGTKDYGPTCINDLRFKDFQRDGFEHVTPELIMENPCAAMIVTAYLLQKEWLLEKQRTNSTPEWQTVIANYHYNYRGNYPARHDKYKNEIREKLELFARNAPSCDTIKQ